ncbi:CBS domain-containing protein [Paracoccus sp. 1_MG-2023]|uniref:CBS domain-containing protein n=1 Tax=unclassified Paracoccus (in: a-proteobacteria) TaxID=2688777 RepID=UPI001C0A512A|nr:MULTISPECIES: CBS domain-containing protein [unclassified Paracoccus (in: a-proteobacteria)]MBU2958991.1 CBS domain-containing protein [Paracoccus sp. C2R09]MDO6668963.1 CBS domain-containing protein [Paracoccus sp. 1_MG-2023]
MVSSYKPHTRDDEGREPTRSQSVDTNLSPAQATVQHILDHKGSEVFWIQPEDTIATAVTVLRDKRIGALPVQSPQGDLVGILSERDIVRRLADTPGQTLPQSVAELMTTQPETCTPADTLVQVLRRMTDGRFRHLPVVDNGNIIGMVSIGDVVNYRLQALEYEALQIKQLIVG